MPTLHTIHFLTQEEVTTDNLAFAAHGVNVNILSNDSVTGDAALFVPYEAIECVVSYEPVEGKEPDAEQVQE